MIDIGSCWETRDGKAGLAPRRLVRVLSVKPGKHNIDKGPTHAPPDDDVAFVFGDGCESVCGTGAFFSNYVPTEDAA